MMASAIFFFQLRGNLEEWLFSSHSTHRAGKEKKNQYLGSFKLKSRPINLIQERMNSSSHVFIPFSMFICFN